MKRLAAIITTALLSGLFWVSPNIANISGNQENSDTIAWARGGRSSGGRVSVRGYFRSNGTYVRPHTRSAPGSGGYDDSYASPNTSTNDWLKNFERQQFRDYMNQGYKAANTKDYFSALTYFQLAESYNPGNSYVKKAIHNMERYLQRQSRSTSYKSLSGSGGIGDLFTYHMKQGYVDTELKQYNSALNHFKAALQERPGNPYAVKAIRNVQNYLKSGNR